MEDNNQSSRRKFIQQTAMAGAGIMLTSPVQVFLNQINQFIWVVILNRKAMQVKMNMEN
ncbi:twin-arginine translocation signal domain-containing protein [Paraflavitalea speifideaquila]|uniref:twin-arginine translocation signal domain-containing protein n=1 Tax=Paraflavitalea speifideaquila TaxID=3076558 RepID=UPI00331301A8